MDGEERRAVKSFEQLRLSPVENSLHADGNYSIRSGWYMLGPL